MDSAILGHLSSGCQKVYRGLYPRADPVFQAGGVQGRGDRIIYCNLPVHPAAVYANKVAGGDRIHISQPDFLLISVIRVLFGKTELMQGKDFSCLNKNGQHCGKNRMRINAQCEGIIAAPTVEWNWGCSAMKVPKQTSI